MPTGKGVVTTLLAFSVLLLEQAYGLPWLFLMLVLVGSYQASTLARLVMWVATGVTVAILYHFSLSLGLAAILLLMMSFELSQRGLKTVRGRMFLSTLIGVITVAYFARMSFTPGVIGSTAVSVLMSLVLARYLFFTGPKKSLRL